VNMSTSKACAHARTHAHTHTHTHSHRAEYTQSLPPLCHGTWSMHLAFPLFSLWSRQTLCSSTKLHPSWVLSKRVTNTKAAIYKLYLYNKNQSLSRKKTEISNQTKAGRQAVFQEDCFLLHVTVIHNNPHRGTLQLCSLLLS
jgi:hypothetical protein